MKSIFKREMSAYFTSPLGYVFIGVFMLLSGSVFRQSLFVEKAGNFQYILASCMATLILLIPIITMRLLAEEKANKTDQLLLTAPVKVSQIVMGKFFAAFCVFLISVLTTLPYLFVAAKWGVVVYSEVIAAYVGYILIGALLISIGLFVSSTTESQIVAAVITYGVVMALLFISEVTVGIGFIDNILKYFSILEWANSFFRSIISLSGLVYYVSFTLVFLFATVRKVESRRWM